jgi:hypothetical protein
MEPKDFYDMYPIKDSQLIRQMSIDNANMALNQAQRISGWDSSSILDYLKNEFENYGILTIQNANTLAGTSVHYKGIEWKIVSVERTSTTYNFLLVREYIMTADLEIKMVLSRVPMAGKLTKVYSLHNDSDGQWVGIGKELLRDKNEFLKQMVGLTDAQN